MKLSLFRVIRRSLLYYRLPSLYQFIVIGLLAAIITGSLLTGNSVRTSLKDNNEERLGSSGFVVSTGARFFPSDLASRFSESTGIDAASLTELKGWARNFSTGKTVLNCQIIAAGPDFFIFNNPSSTFIPERGNAIINSRLAADLDIAEGDEIIVRFGTVSVIPADSPFSAEEDDYETLVLVVSGIIDGESPSNFSLSINQIVPRNIFIHRDDLSELIQDKSLANRMLLNYDPSLTYESIRSLMEELLIPSDIGLTLRRSGTTGQPEYISSRIFIDENSLSDVVGSSPGSGPVLTYLANSIRNREIYTPYSFVSAISDNLVVNGPAGNEIYINRWLADDLGAIVGDTLEMDYYVSGSLNSLREESHSFIVKRVVEIDSIWGDASLMPEFPGISGSESCSNWEAGVPVDLDNIRQKDEDYWNNYQGTPKAFIGYETGRMLWANNFGPATSIRFPESYSEEYIISSLKKRIDPLENGFTIYDARGEAIDAASNSVDFSSLFLSLGFFIIISALLLLSMIVSTYLESRKEHIRIMRAIGFRRGLIRKILFYETAFIALIGSIAGMFAGELFNSGVIKALNSVWKGAVQTDTLSASNDFGTMVIGFGATLAVTVGLLFYKSGNWLKRSVQEEKHPGEKGYAGYTKQLLYFFGLITPALFIGGIILPGNSTSLFFGCGTSLFVSLLLLFYVIIKHKGGSSGLLSSRSGNPSWFYYAFYPSRAITPILFIAAGLFIVIATGANRKSFDTNLLSRENGTGGFILWGETAAPLNYDLNSSKGRDQFGMDRYELSNVTFIQGRVADGDDASCLNLNQVSTPPLLGIDASAFASMNAFSFATRLKSLEVENIWEALAMTPGENCIYGVIDQTVLQWSLGLKAGDTITVATETGEPLNIIIAGGLVSSVFQGYIVIGNDAFTKYIPSIAGSKVFLVDASLSDAPGIKQDLTELFEPYGTQIEYSWDRLAMFNQVSNTYLTVFLTLGGLGMLLGIIGLGFILLRNFNLRKKEYSLLLATGFTPGKIRKNIFREHFLILCAGIFTGSVPALIATIPSLTSGTDIPVLLLIVMIGAIFLTGIIALVLSARSLVRNKLIEGLRKE